MLQELPDINGTDDGRWAVQDPSSDERMGLLCGVEGVPEDMRTPIRAQMREPVADEPTVVLPLPTACRRHRARIIT